MAAQNTNSKPVDTVTLLRRLLTDTRFATCRRLEKYGIDVDALLRSALDSEVTELWLFSRGRPVS